MEFYLLVKWLHIVSSTVLFGFGAGTAWYFWNAHLSGDPALIARVGKMVVKADWIFTGTSGVVQPVSGIMLARLAGYSLFEPWLVAAYCLYAIAFLCWAPVVWLQIKAQRLAQTAARNGAPLGFRVVGHPRRQRPSFRRSGRLPDSCCGRSCDYTGSPN